MRPYARARSENVMRFAPKTTLLAALLAVATAVPSVARADGAPAYPPACEDSKVSSTDRERAHDLFKLGKQFLAESSYDKAIAMFRESYGIGCNVHEILTIIATAYERKGDRVEAVRALEEYLRRIPNASDRDVIERRIKNLREQMGPQPSTTVTPVPVSATTSPVSVTTPPPAEAPPERSVAPWIVVGTGGALLVTGGVLFGVGMGQVKSAENVCGKDHQCPPGDTDNVNKGKSGQTLQTVGLIVGGVGLAAAAFGLVWHLTEVSGEKSEPHASQGARARVKGREKAGAQVAPSFGPGYAGIAVGGRF
jgi:hypothetical protein